ncbi:phosphopantetheine-binding protein [Nonomuraea sp. NPDC003201]
MAADMTREGVIEVTVTLIAAEQDRDPAELREELESKGSELPIDSQLIAEVLARVEEHFGVRIPADNEAARSLRSLHTFATTILAAATRAVASQEVS